MNISAKTYWSELRAIALSEALPQRRFDMLGSLFSTFIDEAVADVPLIFAGQFAKTDYLLKQHSVPPALAAAIHRTRRRLRRRASLSPEVCSMSLPGDIAAVAALVAAITGEEAPQELVTAAITAAGQGDTTYNAVHALRVIVDSVEGTAALCHADDDNDNMLSLDLTTAGTEHLATMLRPGSQLNLISPAIRGDRVSAELVVYEPDYLVNVTQLAACFESYGTDARLNILKKLAPAACSEAINLGNFASQLLDEEVHRGADEAADYNASVRRFFRNNALSLAAGNTSASFHSDANTQRANIATAIRSHMPQYISDFDRHNVILEPSFFAEMLGLQGRMDFLQTDHRVLLEQKAGKGEWPQGDYSVPRQKLTHYVQLLLYMAVMRYNFADEYNANSRRLSAFLLYSRYSKPLLGLGFAPDLLAEAMEVRNRIVDYDLRLARGETDFLEDLTPDDLNQRPETRLWVQYSRPQLGALLDPLHRADHLTKAYYRRMLRFVAAEHVTAKMGNKSKTASGFAASWHNALAEKLEAGNMFAGLILTEPAPGHEGKVETLALDFSDDSANDMANFRKGDSVLLYPYAPGKEPDVRRTMAFRATITTISDRQIRLRLRFAQSGAMPFTRNTGCRWAIEHDFMESAHNAMFQGLHALLSAPAGRRDLLLLRRRPATDPTARTVLDHGDFSALATRVKQTRDFFLIIGPPGTGKTSFGMMSTVREALAEKDCRILLLSYTNRAVDEMCGKLSAEGIDYIRIGAEAAADPACLPHMLQTRLDGCANVGDVRRLIKSAKVVTATIASLNASLRLFDIASFDLAVIDEASQILEPQLCAILSATGPDGQPAVKKFVMIGDHKQLPAVVQQTAAETAVDDPLLLSIGLNDCRNSLFERLLRRYADDPAVTYLLSRQGRMHADIAAFPSQAFYKGRLVPVGLPHQTADTPAGAPPLNVRLSFVNITADGEDASDKVNSAEARYAAALAEAIYRRESDFDPDDTLGIIVPYRNQINAIRKAIAATGIEALGRITVDTVERFQGSQRKYIIYGFTVRRPGQLRFLSEHTFTEDGASIDRKLNVALTRAREYIIMTGNASLLSGNPVFASLIEHVRERGGYFEHGDAWPSR